MSQTAYDTLLQLIDVTDKINLALKDAQYFYDRIVHSEELSIEQKTEIFNALKDGNVVYQKLVSVTHTIDWRK